MDESSVFIRCISNTPQDTEFTAKTQGNSLIPLFCVLKAPGMIKKKIKILNRTIRFQ